MFIYVCFVDAGLGCVAAQASNKKGKRGKGTYLPILISKGQGDFAISNDVFGRQRGTDPSLFIVREPALCAFDIGIQRHCSTI